MNYKYNDNELLYMIKENKDIIDIVITKYEPLIKSIAISMKNKYFGFNIDLEDLVQEGRIGLFNACNYFSEQKNIIFYSFAVLCIKRHIINYIRNSFSLKNKSNMYINYYDINDFDEILYTYDHPLNTILNKEVIDCIYFFGVNLDFDDACIFYLKIDSFSYKDIALILDLSVKNVDNKMLKIHKKLKKYLLEANYCL